MMLRAIPPLTSTGRNKMSRRAIKIIPDLEFRFVGSGQQQGTTNDKWTIEQYGRPIRTIRRKPKIVIRSINEKTSIELFDNDDHYLILSVRGKPTGIGIKNLITILSPPIGRQVIEQVNNGIWQAVIKK